MEVKEAWATDIRELESIDLMLSSDDALNGAGREGWWDCIEARSARVSIDWVEEVRSA